MKTQFFCPFWGHEHLGHVAFIQKAKKSGYDGIEILPPHETSQKEQIKEECEKNELAIIGVWGGMIEGDFETSLDTYKKHLENACSIDPIFVNIQTGKDHYTYDQNRAFLDAANEISERTGIKVIHETHRSKFSNSAHGTVPFLEKDENLRITADFSHWCCVAETLLEDQPKAVELAISRTDHIHARVGHTQGSQVPDPRAPEWQHTLETHMKWWDQIIALHQEKEKKFMTITPEFGPFPYMPMIPLTQQPITSQWDVNVYMKDLLKERYNK
ncbi:MAG: sugar phosphate isomerase/epimerase [Bacteroidota bacterium]